MTEVLRKGDKGVEVKELQHALQNTGYDIGGVDGIFGTKTAVALQAFQKQLGDTNTKRIKAVGLVETNGSAWYPTKS